MILLPYVVKVEEVNNVNICAIGNCRFDLCCFFISHHSLLTSLDIATSFVDRSQYLLVSDVLFSTGNSSSFQIRIFSNPRLYVALLSLTSFTELFVSQLTRLLKRWDSVTAWSTQRRLEKNGYCKYGERDRRPENQTIGQKLNRSKGKTSCDR